MAYEGQCGSCENFQEADSNQLYDDKHNSALVKGYCTWYHCYYYPDDTCNSHYKEKPRDLLFEYDTIGPKIATELLREDSEVIQRIQKSYLVPIVGMIEAGKDQEAIHKYQFLTRMLQHHYGIDSQGEATIDYDYTSGGHGFFKRRSE